MDPNNIFSRHLTRPCKDHCEIMRLFVAMLNEKLKGFNLIDAASLWLIATSRDHGNQSLSPTLIMKVQSVDDASIPFETKISQRFIAVWRLPSLTASSAPFLAMRISVSSQLVIGL